MKVLVLILASNSEDFNQFEELWRKYMKIDSDFECYFIKADPTITNTTEERDNTIFVKTLELYENIFYKSQQALKYFENRISEFNYIFRTNLSSFIVFSKYKNWLHTLPTYGVYNGSILWCSKHIYASGCGFTITPDIAKLFIESDKKQILLDDITYGIICKENNIQVSSAPLNNINFNNLESELNNFDSYECMFHYRLKSETRNNDITLYKMLLGMYYYIV